MITPEEQTREEVLRNLAAQTEALTFLVRAASMQMAMRRAATQPDAIDGNGNVIDIKTADPAPEQPKPRAPSRRKKGSTEAEREENGRQLRENAAKTKFDPTSEEYAQHAHDHARNADPEEDSSQAGDGGGVATPAEQVDTIKPVKAGKSPADLRAALQACITKHGMDNARERLKPFIRISDVADDKIQEVIDRLEA